MKVAELRIALDAMGVPRVVSFHGARDQDGLGPVIVATVVGVMREPNSRKFVCKLDGPINVEMLEEEKSERED